MSKRIKKLEAPEYSVEWKLVGEDLYCDFSRLEKSRDGLFCRLERQSFRMPIKLLRKIVMKGKKP